MKRSYAVGLIVGVLVLMLVVLYRQQVRISSLQEEEQMLLGKIAHLEQTLGGDSRLDDAVVDAVKEAVGLDLNLVAEDEKVASDFFDQAFNWTSGETYEQARQFYMDELGEDNTFTDVYLPPDIVIELSTGSLYRIDHRGLKVHMDDLTAIPLTAEGNRVRYVGFVRYYPYKEKQDLNNLSALEHSSAIIEFTVSGDSGSRKVSEVEAYVGFTSTIQSN